MRIMLVRVIVLFLAFIAVLAMVGRLRPTLFAKRREAGRLDARKCPKCGTFRIGPGPCPCERDP